LKLAIGVMCVASLVSEHGARANCDEAPARPATIDVYECSYLGGDGGTSTLENNGSGQGVLVRGSVTWKKGGTEDNLRLWLPGTEMPDCSKLLAPGQVAANVEKVCCESRAGAVCEVGADAVVSSSKLVPAKPVKKATRGQLESEVEKLRAENARLRAEVFKMNAVLRAENERLRREAQELSKKMK
jgi:hypothetical protein